MATNMPQGDLVGWRKDMKHFGYENHWFFWPGLKETFPAYAGVKIIRVRRYWVQLYQIQGFCIWYSMSMLKVLGQYVCWNCSRSLPLPRTIPPDITPPDITPLGHYPPEIFLYVSMYLDKTMYCTLHICIKYKVFPALMRTQISLYVYYKM